MSAGAVAAARGILSIPILFTSLFSVLTFLTEPGGEHP
jgi:hypothetical protein